MMHHQRYVMISWNVLMRISVRYFLYRTLKSAIFFIVLSPALKISMLYHLAYFECAHFNFSSNHSTMAISCVIIFITVLITLHWCNKPTNLGGSHQIRFTLKCSTNSSLICINSILILNTTCLLFN